MTMHTVWRTLFHSLWLHLSWLFGNRLLQCIISQTAHPFCNNKIIANLGFAAFSKFHFFAINKPFSDLYGWSFCHFSEFKNIVENIDCRLNCVCKTFFPYKLYYTKIICTCMIAIDVLTLFFTCWCANEGFVFTWESWERLQNLVIAILSRDIL